MFGDFPREFGHSSSGLAVKTVDSFFVQKFSNQDFLGFIEMASATISIAKVVCCWWFVANYSFSDETV